MFSIFRGSHGTTPADRLLHLFEAHRIERVQIPRLLPAIGYAQLQDRKALLGALTPSVLDSAARQFGVRSQWVEGLDELVYLASGSHHAPANENARLVVAAVAEALSTDKDSLGVPLCALTTVRRLDRTSPASQMVLPIVVEPTGAILESPVLRCRIFRGYFDWRDREQRLALKALVRLVWQRCRRVVPLYEVTEDELQNISGGLVIPSVVFSRSVITNPSLEDYVESEEHSGVAKEVDELAEVLDYLPTSRLESVWDDVVAGLLAEATACPTPSQASSAPAAAEQRQRPGKRDQQEQAWAAICNAASGIWSTTPDATYAEVIRRLQSMPLLKAASLSESALRKRLAGVAPPGVRGKPGRRPKQSP